MKGTLKGCSVTELPTFDWITEPQEVPAALKELNPDQDVVCVLDNDKRRRSHLTHVATAQEHIAEIESLMSQQAMGRYTIAEVAKILAKENQLDEMKLLARLQEAANVKKLTVTDPDTGGTPIAPNAQPLVFSHWVSPDSVNALLKEWGVCYRFAWPRPWRTEGTAMPAPAPMVPEQAAGDDIDFAVLASPEKLIAAFGRFTGMDASWFDKWVDYPVLKNAIKVRGTSGRGRTTQPLFCPFLVMQGLMKKPRKGSNRIAFQSTEKPWELLKRHFVNVYATHQGVSPLDD
jgi:hypothetical protein